MCVVEADSIHVIGLCKFLVLCRAAANSLHSNSKINIQPGAMLSKLICHAPISAVSSYSPCLNSSWSVCLLGLRSILGLVPNHRWYCSAVTVAWKANSWQRHPWHAETRWEPLLWANGQLHWLSSLGPTVFHRQLEKESGWTSMFYQGAICVSAWGLFTTICVLTSHRVLSCTVTLGDRARRAGATMVNLAFSLYEDLVNLL